jgi:hypothetical protein
MKYKVRILTLDGEEIVREPANITLVNPETYGDVAGERGLLSGSKERLFINTAGVIAINVATQG